MALASIQPTLLVILDGFGHADPSPYNAVSLAKKPTIDFLLKTYPHTLLQAAGSAVGLFDGMNGNSEVGHETIGTGRIIMQDAVRISDAIADGSFFTNPTLKKVLTNLAQQEKTLHILGLLSDGGVHSEQSHLYAFLQAAKQYGIKKVYVHAILDGRDVAPKSAKKYLQDLDNHLKTIQLGNLGSLHGRFYTLDRDKNWERTAASYHVLTEKQELQFPDWHHALKFYYDDGITDEFIPPIQLDANSIIQDNDGVIFFNFRPDRARQITAAFVQPDFTFFKRKKIQLSFFLTPVSFDGELKTTILFQPQHITNTLNDVLAAVGKTIFAIAETEKYAHVTYFFNGGQEKPHAHETRILIPSLPQKNYIQHPEMSAKEITQAIIHSLKTDPKDFYVINYANADMVGHSGNLEAAIKAVECIDEQLKVLYDIVVKQLHGTLFITADHGNAEKMFDEKTKQPKTSHTKNPVYFIMIQEGLENKALPCADMHGLSDVAPCILQSMNLPIPKEMKK